MFRNSSVSLNKADSRSTRRRRTSDRRPATRRPSLEALEGRLLLTVRTWDGTSPTSNSWTDRFNWVGDVAPVANDDLVFPVNAARKTGQVVSFPIGTTFSSITYTGS